jgi:hypothetical protein
MFKRERFDDDGESQFVQIFLLGAVCILRSTTAPKGPNDAFRASWSTTNTSTFGSLTFFHEL